MNYDELLNHIKRIHFIGIGGSGMCPLAEILRSEGFELSGSDMNEGETLDRIKGYGIPEEDAVRASTWNPACAIGAENIVGSIETGKRADFLVCSPDYTQKRVFLAGKTLAFLN